MELVCPSQYGQTVASELFHVPVSVRRMKRLKDTAAGMFAAHGTIAIGLLCEGDKLTAYCPHTNIHVLSLL